MHPLQKQSPDFKFWYALSLAWQLGFLIIVPIVGFMALGIWLDAVVSTPPLFLLIGLVIGIGITAYEVYHSLFPFLNRHAS